MSNIESKQSLNHCHNGSILVWWVILDISNFLEKCTSRISWIFKWPIKANLGHMLLIVNLVEKWPNFYDYQFWKRVEYNDPAHASSICNKVTTTFRPTTINLSAFKGVKVITREPCSWNEVKSFLKE